MLVDFVYFLIKKQKEGVTRVRRVQVALWADLGRCCYYAGGINDSCAQRKSKMGWSEVATLVRCGLGVTCNKPIRASSHIPFKSRRACSMASTSRIAATGPRRVQSRRSTCNAYQREK